MKGYLLLAENAVEVRSLTPAYSFSQVDGFTLSRNSLTLKFADAGDNFQFRFGTLL
jgi:hypothetical protein